MRKNLYYHELYVRKNFIKQAFRNLIFALGAPAQHLLSVFIRKDFGERYFSKNLTRFWILILLWSPALYLKAETFIGRLFEHRNFGPVEQVSWLKFGTWYLFIIAFWWFARKRRKEITFSKSTYDFGRFSWSSGTTHPFFYTAFGKSWNPRQIATLLEPGLFCVVGFILWMLEQKIGGVILVAGLFYGWSYRIAYKLGDEFVLDTIDEMICNEEIMNNFSTPNPVFSRGFQFYGRTPNEQSDRQKIVPNFFDGDNDGVFEAL